jgi:hypothetical protein
VKPTELSPEQLKTAGRNAFLLQEAEAIASALDARNVPTLFLKGIALLETAYSGLAARGMADIDLLVHPRDLKETVAVLRGRGYAAHSNALVLNKSVGKIQVDVDLHAGLWYFGGDRLWQCSEFKQSSAPMRILHPEAALLHCILHSMIQDGGVSPQALADCRAILGMDGGKFAWDAFAAMVAEEGWEKPAALFIERLEAAQPGIVPQAGFDGVSGSPVLFGRSHSFRWPYLRMLAMQSRWRRRIRLLLCLLFPHPLFLGMRYSWMPRKLAFLLPVLRPFFLLSESIACRLGSSPL